MLRKSIIYFTYWSVLCYNGNEDDEGVYHESKWNIITGVFIAVPLRDRLFF